MTIYQNTTCPFCSLLCDDLVIQSNNDKLKIVNTDCKKAIHCFENTETVKHSSIKGKRVTIKEAITHATKLIQNARQPLIAGLGTDVAGMQALLKLADKAGAIIDHMYSDGAVRNIKVLQDYGWMMTTLSEIKNRADLIILTGTDGINNYPRFFERAIWNKNSLFNNTKQRDIVYIGDNLNTTAGKSPDGHIPTVFNCKQELIGEVISSLHALIAGNQIQKNEIAGIKLTTLQKLAQRMKDAKYGVIVWAPGELEFKHAELTIEAICGVIKYLNRTTRFSGFTLAGNDGGITANNVSTWQCGYPLRVNFTNGYPEYDPNKFSTRNLLQKKEVDALIWVSSFNTRINPPRAKIPTLVLSAPANKLIFKPDIYIPVGTPGVDHQGHMFRTDSVVALPLKKIRDTEYMSVHKIITRITESLR